MPINFPNSPTPNDLYTYDDKTWQWNGIYWDVYSGLTGYITSAYTVGDGYSDISGVTNGYIALKSFSGQNINIIDSGDKLTFSGLSVSDVPMFTGGTVSGATNFTNGLTATTISATTYQNLPIDVFVTGGTFNSGTATFTNNTGGTFNVTGFFPGSQDIFVTGATYSNNTFTYTNNTGGTFSVLFNTITGITVNGSATITGNTVVNGIISGNTIFSTQSSGDEGGQIDLFKPQTNTTISGTSVSIDVYQNKVRIFESGGNSRGAYIDITDASTGLTNNLLGIVAFKNISPVTVSASTANTILQSIFIPANTFKAGDLIEASYRGKKVGTNNTAPFRLYANTALSLIGPTVISVTNFNPATNVYNSVFRTLQVVTSNNNTEVFGSATLANTDFANSTAPVTNLSLDWTTDQYLFTASQPVSSLDSVTSTYLLLKRIR